jgi:hypothetical protein
VTTGITHHSGCFLKTAGSVAIMLFQIAVRRIPRGVFTVLKLIFGFYFQSLKKVLRLVSVSLQKCATHR